MQSHEELIEHLKNTYLKTPTIIAAFKKVDRAGFTDSDTPYIDYPLRIGHGQTISQPITVAIMLELLQAGPGHNILDVGSGSGWTTALLSELVGKGGFVHGVEYIPELVILGRKNLSRYGAVNTAIKQAGRDLGLPEEAVFDRILVSAAADELPDELLEQLARPGRMVLPIRKSVWLVEKDLEGTVSRTEYPGFGFVPLK